MKKKLGKSTLILLSIAVIAIAATGVTAYAVWYSGATKNSGNTITTGTAVAYTLTGDISETGLMPGGSVTQTLTVGLDGDTSATLAVSNMTAKDGDNAVVAGISTYLTYKLYAENGTTEVAMTGITADGTYKLTFTLAAATPTDFAGCTITYTLSLSSNTLS